MELVVFKHFYPTKTAISVYMCVSFRLLWAMPQTVRPSDSLPHIPPAEGLWKAYPSPNLVLKHNLRCAGQPQMGICIFFFCCCYNFIHAFIFGCAGSPLLCGLFSSCRKWESPSSCGVWASRGGGFSSCRARALAHSGCSALGSWALEHRLNSCDTWA